MSITSIDTGADVVRALRAKLEAHRRSCAKRAGWTQRFVPTGLRALDGVLPGGGAPAGSIIEILSEADGVGSLSLSLRIAMAMTGGSFSCAVHEGRRYSFSTFGTAREQWHKAARQDEHGGTALDHATRKDNHDGAVPMSIGSHAARDDHRAIVLIDTWKDFCFYPPAAWRWGIDPHRLIVVRPRDVREALWAADQSLRCNAVAAVIASLDRIDERDSRRLQLAAESSGCVGLILRAAHHHGKSFAAVQMLVEGVGSRERSVLQTGEMDLGADEHGGTGPIPFESLATQGDKHGGAALGHATRGSRDVRLCRITLLKVREGTPGGPVIVDVNDETGDGVIPPVPVDRPAVKRA